MRTDTPLIDVPQSVTVVSAKQINDQAANSIGDAIRYVPGVFSAQGEGNRETLVFRGNSTTGDFFVDGIRDDVQTYRDLYNIERLEVFKGPNAMVFGRGGVGGLINRVTKVADWTRIAPSGSKAAASSINVRSSISGRRSTMRSPCA
jgi:catecholate siderophore receptor